MGIKKLRLLLIIIIILLHAISAVASPNDLSFKTAVFYPVGSSPFNIQTGDFNGDDILDLVIANQDSNNISILLGKGDGTFNPRVNYTVGTEPLNLTLGDYNRDDKLDIAVANYRGDNCSVLFGKGDGTFNPHVTIGIGIKSANITTGDYNGDEIPDLAIIHSASNYISVLLGYGDGSFKPQETYYSGVQPVSIIAKDLNRDGKLDLVSANYNKGQSNISVLIGKDDGTFNAPIYYSVGKNPRICSGDYNNDGNPDLAVANSLDDNVSVLLGKGDGTFYTKGTYQTGALPAYILDGDFDGDGKLDLVVPNRESGYISIMTGRGDGTFDPQVIFSAGSQPTSLAVGDFNRDGKQDIAVTDEVNNRVAVLINNNSVPVNQPPVLAPIGNQMTDQGQMLQLVIRASDPNHDTLTFAAANLPEGATFDPATQIFSWTPGFTQEGSFTVRFEVSDGSLTASQEVLITVNKVNLPPVFNYVGNQTVDEGALLQFTIKATDPNEDPITYSAFNLPTGASFDPETQIFKWTPNYNQAGIYTVSFQASDGNLTESRDVIITVNQVNRPPVIAEISNQIVDEGQSIQFTVSATDPDGDVLTYSAAGIPEGASFDPGTQTFSWTPNYTQAGSYTVNFQVNDGALTVSRDVYITVTPVNLLPELAAIGDQTIDEGQLLQFTVSATDPDGDVLSYSATGLPEGASFDPSTQTFSWTPGYNQAGTYTITFRVSDGSLTAGRDVHITVNQVNLPPELMVMGDQIVDEGKLLKFTVSATDPDGDILTYSATGLPEGASFDQATQTFCWTPNYAQAGSYTINFQVSDGSLTVSKDILIAVNQVNLPPELAAIGDQTIDEGQTLRLTVSATDLDGDILTYSATGLPEGASFDQTTQTFSWTPDYTQAGSYTFKIQVSDGSLTASRNVLIIVNQVNLPPELAIIGNRTVKEGQLLTFKVSATDPDGDVLTYSATGIPEGASFDPAMQVFSWTPKLNQAGVYEVIFAVTDGLIQSQETVSITVSEVNDPETRIKALIELLIRIIERSKLPDHYKSKIINELRKSTNFNKVETNKLKAIINGIKAQIGKKVPKEIEDTIKNLLEEICKLDGHRNSKPGKDDHWKKDNKPDKDDHWGKDCKSEKDDYNKNDHKPDKDDHKEKDRKSEKDDYNKNDHKPDKDDRREKDRKSDKDDHHEKDHKSVKNDHPGGKQDGKGHHDNR